MEAISQEERERREKIMNELVKTQAVQRIYRQIRTEMTICKITKDDPREFIMTLKKAIDALL